ncbi:MAG: hypothetical protein IAE82_11425 [Opitutaceae bacterium]|nr:hypothetical protein [Opitutaceae bacterium]
MAFESTDLVAFRDRLRSAGFPDWAVAALVGRRIDAHFDEVRRQRLGPAEIDPFWKSPDPARDQQRRRVAREISREQAAMRREILGPISDPVGTYQAGRLAFLPPDKVDLIARLESDYSELSSDVRMDGGGRMILEEDREKLLMIEREKRADLAAALTPEELEAYDLRHSQTAQSVRGRMANFDPTEEEFLAVYALQKVFDERFPPSVGMTTRSPEEMKARRDAEAELKTQIRAALGEDRYLEYERSGNHGYQTALKIVDHFKLPRENAASVYTLESEYRQRQSEAMRGSQDQAARNEALTALAAEASARVVALLGEEGARAFKETGGHWLRNLEQQAGRAAPPAQRP